jgi:hypothetical protein
MGNADHIKQRLSLKKNDYLILKVCNAHQLADEYELANDLVDYLETNQYLFMDNFFRWLKTLRYVYRTTEI